MNHFICNYLQSKYLILTFKKCIAVVMRMLNKTINCFQPKTIACFFKFTLVFFLLTVAITLKAQRNYANNSVLSSGSWFKIGVTKGGIYKIDVDFLNKLGINTNGFSSNSIRIYGNGGGILPENNAIPRVDDLFENPIWVNDGGDGLFNNNDYLLFYAQGPHQWVVDSTQQTFAYQTNLYTDTAFYFISIQAGGKRIAQLNTTLIPNLNIYSYTDHLVAESDSINLLNSGKSWWSNALNQNAGLSRDFVFPVPGILPNTPLVMQYHLAGRSVGGNSSFSIFLNQQLIATPTITAVSGYFLDAFASEIQQTAQYITHPADSLINIHLQLNAGVAAAQGWWQQITLQCNRQLAVYNNKPLLFSNVGYVGNGQVGNFKIMNVVTGTRVWDVSQPLWPIELPVQINNQQLQFVQRCDSLKQFIVFSDNTALTPIVLGLVPNQNLHNSPPVDFIIITHPLFLAQANQLAAFHTQQYAQKVQVVTTQQIYQEFGSGSPDPSAIRDFLKMYSDKYGNDSTLALKYVLMFGAASFDYKNRLLNNTNFVPAYESNNSLEPLNTYVTDDFFGLLGNTDNINVINLSPPLKIAIGRFPVRSVNEANTMLHKVIRYHSNTGFGAWRNQAIFVADDKDNDLHLQDAESIASSVAQYDTTFNISKIYLDAYPQVSGAGGSRYPQVNTAIVNQLYNGALLFNYNGHGGYQQLSNSAVFGQAELQQLNNADKLPLFITATCDFAPYDDPTKNSLGGGLLYGSNVGAIALLTTTRVVFAYSNQIINNNYIKAALQPNAVGNYPTIGQAVQIAKNNTYLASSDVLNNRKFTLLGDPAMQLAFPKLQIKIDSLNLQLLTGNDTLKALNTYIFNGHIANAQGQIQQTFNGNLVATLFDKPQLLHTLGNDPASPVTTFSQQTNIIYKGQVSVVNGRFKVRFVVPKDINYKVGNGKLSLYAWNDSIDAAGYTTQFLIGGGDSLLTADTTGPMLKAFLNDTLFRNGGKVGPNPVLLVQLFDSLGINTIGAGIGHDITAVLDGNTNNPIILNNFYEASPNSFQAGTITYPFIGLAPGMHTLTIKAWNIANYARSVTIQFEVSNSTPPKILSVYNYPNPFSNQTTFHIVHNMTGAEIKVSIDVFNLNGSLVARLLQTLPNTSGGVLEMNWDGSGLNNKKILNGLYFYHIIASSNTGKAEATAKMIVH